MGCAGSKAAGNADLDLALPGQQLRTVTVAACTCSWPSTWSTPACGHTCWGTRSAGFSGRCCRSCSSCCITPSPGQASAAGRFGGCAAAAAAAATAPVTVPAASSSNSSRAEAGAMHQSQLQQCLLRRTHVLMACPSCRGWGSHAWRCATSRGNSTPAAKSR
jgi:hypothetical protein